MKLLWFCVLGFRLLQEKQMVRIRRKSIHDMRMAGEAGSSAVEYVVCCPVLLHVKSAGFSLRSI